MTDTRPTLTPPATRPKRGLGKLLRDAALDAPDRPFLQDTLDNALTFGQASVRVEDAAKRLRAHGLVAGDRVGIHLSNDVYWPLTWLTVVSAGFVAVPINRSYEAGDISHVLEDAGVSIVVTEVDLIDRVRAAATSRPPTIVRIDSLFGATPGVAGTLTIPGPASTHDPLEFDAGVHEHTLANLQYTSGTSGMPKACMLTHGYWLEVGRAMGSAFGLTEADRLITAQPFSYIDPMWMVTMSLQLRIPLVVLNRFSASTFWSEVRKHKASVLYVLGSMPQLLLAQPQTEQDRDNDVRLVLCSAIPPAIHTQLEARWDSPWREAYGLTESGLNILAPLHDSRSVGQGLLGVPAPGWHAKVIDTEGHDVLSDVSGELVVSGPSMMTGYWNRPEATEQVLRDGWFHTGDLAIRRPDGWFRLVGRLKDSIRRGGENIAASEVEEIIRELPEVHDCAVVGVEDPLFGQEVKVHVEVPEGTVAEGLPARIQDHVRSRLAPFKVPRYVDVWRSLPRTPSERIAKHKITDQPADALLLSVDLGQRGRRTT